MTTARLTRLEAVNAVLQNAGFAPVSSLSAGGPQHAIHADQVLTEQTSAVLEDGWWFNREFSYSLPRDGSNRIPLPANSLLVDLDDGGRTVERNGYLYDTVDNTDVFTSDQVADVVFLMDFEDLPRVAQSYIVARAKTEFQETRVGDQAVTRMNTARELEARRRLMGTESSNRDANIINSTPLLRHTVRRRPRIGFSGGRANPV